MLHKTYTRKLGHHLFFFLDLDRDDVMLAVRDGCRDPVRERVPTAPEVRAAVLTETEGIIDLVAVSTDLVAVSTDLVTVSTDLVAAKERDIAGEAEEVVVPKGWDGVLLSAALHDAVPVGALVSDSVAVAVSASDIDGEPEDDGVPGGEGVSEGVLLSAAL